MPVAVIEPLSVSAVLAAPSYTTSSPFVAPAEGTVTLLEMVAFAVVMMPPPDSVSA